MIDVIYIPNNKFISSIYVREDFDCLFAEGPLRIQPFGHAKTLFYRLLTLYNTLRNLNSGARFDTLFTYFSDPRICYIPSGIKAQSFTYCSQFFVKTDFLLISTE